MLSLCEIDRPADGRRPASSEREDGATPQSGDLFPPGRPILRIQREALVLLAGGRAVLMQLAHPLVAAGVAEYSNFASDPLRRLLRTLHFMHTIVFDDKRRAESLARFHRMHEQIRGRLHERVGAYPRGTPYAGDAPDLKLWVHATLVDSSLEIYQRFVRPLSQDERGHYYEDTLRLGRLLGIPAGILPPTLPAFRSYVDAMVESDQLAVDQRARRLAYSVLHPDVGFIPGMSARLLRFVTAGTLPPRLCEAFGLAWSRPRATLLDGLCWTTRTLRPHVGPSIWQAPLQGGGLARWLLWGGAHSTPERDTCPFGEHGSG